MSVRTERARLLGVLDARIGIVAEEPMAPKSARKAKRSKVSWEHYGVALPDNLYIETFSYPMNSTKIDKAWEKSNGLRLAQCLKAILGKRPFRWNGPDSAERMAEDVFGRAVQLEYDATWEADRIVVSSRETDENESQPRARGVKPTVEQQSLFGKAR